MPDFEESDVYLIKLVEVEGEGIVKVNDQVLEEESDSVEIEAGSEVMLSAETDTGWYFDFWSKDIAEQESSEFNLVVDENYEIGVIFGIEKSTLNIKAIEHGKRAGEKSTVTVMVDGQRREEIETGTSATIEIQKGASVELVSNEGEYSPFIAWADEHN